MSLHNNGRTNNKILKNEVLTTLTTETEPIQQNTLTRLKLNEMFFSLQLILNCICMYTALVNGMELKFKFNLFDWTTSVDRSARQRA